MKQFYTVEEIAALFQVTIDTVRKMLRNGDIVGVRIGPNWRVMPEDLQAYLDQAKQQARKGYKQTS